ncbi:MAG TPA: hypothetical protein VM734_01685 [Kofleriaceae bacterium]|nr:hypothetical protein [Kofleriaceae bacterium]
MRRGAVAACALAGAAGIAAALIGRTCGERGGRGDGGEPVVGGEARPGAGERVPAARVVAGPPAAGSPRPEATPVELPPLPPSLRGTEVDGAYTLDETGALIGSPAVRDRFDYYLAAEGEEPFADLRARVAADAAAALAPEAAAAALDLFDRYVAYRIDGQALLETRPADPVAALAALQRERFGEADAARMFGAELAALQAALAARAAPAPR